MKVKKTLLYQLSSNSDMKETVPFLSRFIILVVIDTFVHLVVTII